MWLDRIFLYGISGIILLVVEIIRFIRAKKLNMKFFSLREFLVIIFELYLVALISVTFFPLRIDARGASSIYSSVNLMPIANMVQDIIVTTKEMGAFMIKVWIVNIIWNIILLAPLAVLIPSLFKKFRNLKSTVILCFLTSCAIEFLQFLSLFLGNMRSVDIDDIILNTLGAFIGFGVFKILSRFSFYSKNI